MNQIRAKTDPSALRAAAQEHCRRHRAWKGWGMRARFNGPAGFATGSHSPSAVTSFRSTFRSRADRIYLWYGSLLARNDALRDEDAAEGPRVVSSRVADAPGPETGGDTLDFTAVRRRALTMTHDDNNRLKWNH